MCKSFVATTILLCLLAQPAFAQGTWTKASPGAGGSFQTVDVAVDGKVLVGSDLSGAYLRSGTGNWTRLGKRDGIDATAVVAVSWKPGQSLIALAGTKKGLFRTTDGGVTWSLVSFAGQHVSAIVWKGTVAYAAGAATSTDAVVLLRKGTNDGQNWTSVTPNLPPIPTFRAVKLAVDAVDPDKVWLLSGHDGYLSGAKTLYRSTTGGSDMLLRSGTDAAIDVAVHPTTADLVLMTTSNNSADTQGLVKSSVNGGGAWAQGAIVNGSTATGAIWWDGSYAYMVNVSSNACGTSGANEFLRSGKFRGSSADWSAGSSWEKIDDGLGALPGTATWDEGWSICSKARGRARSTVAKTLSAKGEYWVTASFVWRYTTSAPFKFENAFSTEVVAGPPKSWITKGIDNAVPRAITGTGSGGLYFAGYYDLGIWKTTDYGGSWANVNPDLGTWDGFGGSVTGIVATSTYTWATMAESSKLDDTCSTAPPPCPSFHYGLWRSSDAGASWQLYRGGPENGGEGLPYLSFMHGLSRDPGSGTLWLTAGGNLYKSTDDGVKWYRENAGSLVAAAGGLYVTQAKNDVVLVGGPHGLHRWNGTSWTEVHAGFNFSTDTGINTNSPLHTIKWHGIHQILFDPSVSNRVWVASYYKPTTSPPHATQRIGIWKSDDNGVSFEPVFKQVLRRGVAFDADGFRLHITSGAATTAGVNEVADMDSARGKETCYRDLNGKFTSANCLDDTFGADYRYPFGGPIYSQECGKIFAGVPGYGFMREDLPCGGGGGCGGPPPELPCEMEGRSPGGEDFGMKMTIEEARGAEAKGLKLYDITGRRVEANRPGVYFDGITRRRIVILRN